MDKIYDKCCGIDVHKKLIVACFRSGKKQEVREFGATTRELLESSDLNAMVVNARHMRAVPGRKTDVKDAEWIADLLQHGKNLDDEIDNFMKPEEKQASQAIQDVTGIGNTSAHRGPKRAYVAVAHSMLISIYHILKDSVVFKDLGADYYNRFNKERKIKAYLKKIKALGWEVPIAAA